MLLLQWEELTRRQAQYEADLTRLEATGDKFRLHWQALAAERQRCLEELHTLHLPLDEVIERCWAQFKTHLWSLCQAEAPPTTMFYAVPYSIRTLAEPVTRNPRLTQ
jgi:hypothetical protein